MWTNEEYLGLIRDALDRNETLVLGVNCSIRYSGRAESFLDFGDRILMIKNDKTLLVHQPTGNAPINYMKPETKHELALEDNKLVLHCKNTPEDMHITIRTIHFFNNHKLEDGQTIIIQGTEEDMAKMLYNNPEMIEKGFKPVSTEEQTKYGFIDVLGTDKNGVLTAIECKRYCADLSAVTQLRRYVEKLMTSKGISNVRGIIAAPKITPNAEQMLKDWGFKFVSAKPPKYLEEYDKKQKTLEFF